MIVGSAAVGLVALALGAWWWHRRRDRVDALDPLALDRLLNRHARSHRE